MTKANKQGRQQAAKLRKARAEMAALPGDAMSMMDLINILGKLTLFDLAVNWAVGRGPDAMPRQGSFEETMQSVTLLEAIVGFLPLRTRLQVNEEQG